MALSEQGREYWLADVFTNRPYAGNPLAVFTDGRGLGDGAMQTIAAELNLSETVFVLPPQDPRHRARLRIFTPGSELPFAGHPTVGAAVLLAEADGASEMVLELGVGPVPVQVAREGAGRHARVQVPRVPEAGPPPQSSRLPALLGLDAGRMAARWPAASWSAGVPFAIVPVQDRQALDAVRLSRPVWDEVMRGQWAPHVFVVDLSRADAGEVHARMFAPDMGIAEDPGTGAAVAALAGYLAAHRQDGDGDHAWTVHQGEAMGRPCRISLDYRSAGGRALDVRIGGSAVTIGSGRLLALPA